MVKRKKNPWIAAILNFIFPGIGYVYIGKRKTFSYLLIASVVSGMVYSQTIPMVWDAFSIAVGFVYSVFYQSAFAYDAYKETKLA